MCAAAQRACQGDRHFTHDPEEIISAGFGEHPQRALEARYPQQSKEDVLIFNTHSSVFVQNEWTKS